jgi:hypothetical protein
MTNVQHRHSERDREPEVYAVSWLAVLLAAASSEGGGVRQFMVEETQRDQAESRPDAGTRTDVLSCPSLNYNPYPKCENFKTAVRCRAHDLGATLKAVVDSPWACRLQGGEEEEEEEE